MEPIPGTRILLVDSHEIVLEGLADILSREPDLCVAGEAASYAEALESCRQRRPDLVVMELAMSVSEGLAAICQMRAEFPSLTIAVLTRCVGDDIVYRAIQAGANAYLWKTASPQELVHAFRAVSTGQTYFSAEVALILAGHLRAHELTRREREILEQMAQGSNNHEIAVALCVEESTVKAHVHRILSKMGVADRTQAVLQAIQRGILSSLD